MLSDAYTAHQDLLDAIGALKEYHRGFQWESQVWARDGYRRSPYRVLILFGLSSRTKDRLLVDVCRRFFDEFPGPAALQSEWPECRNRFAEIVRKGQIPFLESCAEMLQDTGGWIPCDRDSLLRINGVGEKIAECVLAYGWGREALPLDGNACRVVERIMGVATGGDSHNLGSIRNLLKAIFQENRAWMSARFVAMVDLHEIFRLHGQLICTRSPDCARCPVAKCRSRSKEYLAPTGLDSNNYLWADWRELLLDPQVDPPAPIPFVSRTQDKG